MGDESICLEGLDQRRLQSLAAAQGLDYATEQLYRAVCQSRHHGPTIRAIDRLSDETDFPSSPPFRVVIVPGFLYREYPNSGADGRILMAAAEQLGWAHEVIPVQSTGRLSVNARLILDWLKQNSDSPMILASISKGGSDIVAAMQSDASGDAFRNVVGWVDVCGILRGSPVVDRVSKQWWSMLGFRALFAMRRWCFASVLDLRRDGGVLEPGFQVPEHLKVVHVVGFPDHADFVRKKLRDFHDRIGSLGPNDGAILLSDAVTTPGIVYPVRGADHYMRPRFRVQPLCRGVLRYVAGHRPTEEMT
jgi:hypothetical protein